MPLRPRGPCIASASGVSPLLLAGLVLACTGPPTSGPSPAPERRATADTGAATLLELAGDALARGDEATAESRYRRVLASRPDETAALLGLGSIALGRGDMQEARRLFQRALETEPASVGARIGLSDVERAGGNPERARELLEEAVALVPRSFAAHARLADLSGRAPPDASGHALQLSSRHPYDPAVLVRAGAELERAGRREEAVALMERAVWLADLDPPAALEALRRLPALDSVWRERRVVPVQVFADETIRTGPAWRFRMREVWRSMSATLDPLLATRFVPVALAPLGTSDLPDALDGMFQRLLAQDVAAAGIVAGFTARRAPPARGSGKLGVARFLGRHLWARLPPGKVQSRVLAHEMLHLYGGVHVANDVESLMNPEGGAFVLDPPNASIVRALRERRFSGLGFERDVLPWIDVEETIAAYQASLRTNLLLRNAGMAEALERYRASGVPARRRVQAATRLDPHLADVSVFLAQLLVADGRRAEAMMLLDLAAQLYGPRSGRGRAVAASARSLERAVERDLGIPAAP